MSPTFWTSEHSVGNAEVDRQHLHIVDLVNSLTIAKDSGHGAGTTDLILTHLQRYIQAHFVAEERLMELVGYPELDAHRKQHIVCTLELQRLLEAVESSEISAVDCAPRLRQWLHEHLLGTDQHYVRWLNENPKRVAEWQREIAEQMAPTPASSANIPSKACDGARSGPSQALDRVPEFTW